MMNNSLFRKTIIALLLGCNIWALASCDLPVDSKEYEQPDISRPESAIVAFDATSEAESSQFRFRNKDRLLDHYEKHGKEMGYASAEEYEAAASAVVLSPDALSKLEAEDGDYIFYLEETNEIVFISKDGYIRTFFKPDSGKKYYDKQ